MDNKNVESSLIGARYGRLLVLREIYSDPKYHSRKYLCRCDCGNEKGILESNLVRGKSSSCGCLRKEASGTRNRTHGLSKSSIYNTWLNMIKRCKNDKLKAWARYGGRGIKVCERWAVFENFLSDMGAKPNPNSQLDRINNDGNYEPENCRWASPIENGNNKSDNHFLTYKSEKMSVSEWARKLGMNQRTLQTRIYLYKWDTERALTTPVRKVSPRNKNNAHHRAARSEYEAAS